MTIVIILAALILLMAIFLFGGTILTALKLAVAQPSRVDEIRRLRQEGLTVNQEGESA
ncbi:MAG: hypothetical protein V3S24_06435 [Candidatus Tectomicrobia bacterium]